MGNEPDRKNDHVVFLNDLVVENFKFGDKDKIQVECGKCGKSYEITRKMYDVGNYCCDDIKPKFL